MASQNGKMPGRQLLAVAEAAKVLRTSERFPGCLAVERRIVFVRIGRYVRVSESASAKFIQSGVKPMTFGDCLRGRA
jgi:excisionase family DNA binding protein